MLSDSEGFSGDVPEIVDCDLLEAAKENVQPLGTGRRVTALSAILSTPHAQRDAKLSQKRTFLRTQVALAMDDDDGDPLEAYYRLVNWTVENYPQGHSAESGLLELLEEATRTLKDHRGGIWRRELKYLKLWLLYASYVEKPTIIYNFLITNDIGSDFALLYEEHAAVLERDGRNKEADDAYTLGIARRALPTEHLESRYNDFQKRMMSNIMTPSHSTPSIQIAQPRRALTTTASSTPSSSSRNPTIPTSSSNGRLQIFVDPTGSGSQATEDAGTWQDLGTRKTRIKENVPETKKMVGSTIKQAGRSKRVASGSGASGSTSSSRIAIYRDPDLPDMPPPLPPTPKETVPKTPAKGLFAPYIDSESQDELLSPVTPKFTPFQDDTSSEKEVATIASDSVIKVRKANLKAPGPATEAEALRKDPLKNYGPGANSGG